MQRTHGMLTTLLATLVLCLSAPGARAGDLPNCSQNHPGRQNRLEDSIKKGDSEIAKKVAKHVVKYSIQRFGLEGLVSEAEIDNAKSRMYSFLKWKLGSPSAVCGQWVSSGYGHFDKAYSDEAGALLIGIFQFEDKEPELKVPTWMQKMIVAEVGSTGPAIAAGLAYWGVPEVIAVPLGEKIAAELAKATERNTVGYYLPKDFDFDNRLLNAALRARRAYEAERKTGPATKGDKGGGQGGAGQGPAGGKGTETPVPAPKKKG